HADSASARSRPTLSGQRTSPAPRRSASSFQYLTRRQKTTPATPNGPQAYSSDPRVPLSTRHLPKALQDPIGEVELRVRRDQSAGRGIEDHRVVPFRPDLLDHLRDPLHDRRDQLRLPLLSGLLELHPALLVRHEFLLNFLLTLLADRSRERPLLTLEAALQRV